MQDLSITSSYAQKIGDLSYITNEQQRGIFIYTKRMKARIFMISLYCVGASRDFSSWDGWYHWIVELIGHALKMCFENWNLIKLLHHKY